MLPSGPLPLEGRVGEGVVAGTRSTIGIPHSPRRKPGVFSKLPSNMRRTTKLILVMLLALSATGCHFARSGSQPIDFDPFANPALKAADDAE
jgi:hypothetical protein